MMEPKEDMKEVTENAAESDVKAPEEAKKTVDEPKKATSGKRSWLPILILAVVAVLGVVSGIVGWISVWRKNDENDVLKVTIDQKEQIIADLRSVDASNEEEEPAESVEGEKSQSLVITESGWLNRPESVDMVTITLSDYIAWYDEETKSEWAIGAKIQRGDKMEESGNQVVATGKVKPKTIVNVSWDLLNKWYQSDLGKTGDEVFDLSDQIDPDEVVEILAGGFGQAVGEEVILFLMADGTIEYIPLLKMAQTGEVKSYGKLRGVRDVIKFYTTSNLHITTGLYGGGMDIYAQRSDGKYYDLFYVLRSVGAFER